MIGETHDSIKELVDSDPIFQKEIADKAEADAVYKEKAEALKKLIASNERRAAKQDAILKEKMDAMRKLNATKSASNKSESVRPRRLL